MLEKLANMSSPLRIFLPEVLESLEQIKDIHGLDSKEFEVATKIRISALENLVEKQREEPEAVKRVLTYVSETSPKLLTRKNFTTLANITSRLEEEPSLRQRIVQSGASESGHDDIITLLGQKGDNYKFLSTALDLGLTGKQFAEIGKIQDLAERLELSPQLLKGLITLDNQGVDRDIYFQIFNTNPVKNGFALYELLKNPTLPENAIYYNAFVDHLDKLSVPTHKQESSRLVETLNAAEPMWRTSEQIFALSKFLENDADARIDLIKRLTTSPTTPSLVDYESLEKSERLFRQLKSYPDAFEKIVHHNKMAIPEISEFVEKDPSANIPILIRELQKEDTNFSTLNPARLQFLANLEKTFGMNSSTLDALAKLDEHGVALGEVERFLDGDPKRKLLVEHLVEDSAFRNHFFSQQSLENLLALHDLLGPDSPSFQSLSKMDIHVLTLASIKEFIEGKFETEEGKGDGRVAERKGFLDKIIASGANEETLYGPHMQAVLELSELLGDDSSAMQRLLKQEADDPYILESLNRLSKTPTGKAYLDRLADDKIMPLNDVQMNSLYELNWQFEPDKELASRLIELTAQGMKPNELERFIFEHTESIDKVRDMIRNGATAEQLELTRLESLESLGKVLGEHKDALEYLLQFEKIGLDLRAVAAFQTLHQPRSHEPTCFWTW